MLRQPPGGVCLRSSTSRRGAGGGMKIPLPAAQNLFRQTFLSNPAVKYRHDRRILLCFCAAGPRSRAAPAPLVLFRPSGAVGFHKPKQMPRLVSLRCSASPDGLAPLAAEPFALRKLGAWSPCGPRNPPVSSASGEPALRFRL